MLLASERPSTPAGALVLGFGSAVSLWVTWFITHLPWVAMPPGIAMAVVLLAWGLTAVFLAIRYRLLSVPHGIVGGAVASLLGLLALGSKINPDASETAPSTPLLAVGFIITGMLIGLVATYIARAGIPTATAHRPLLPAFAWTTVAAAAPLLFVGGLVTSTNSGMAVPDYPTTMGVNMFLYPLGNAPVDIFLEHSHRLFGTLLGLASLCLMIWAWRNASTANRWWSVGIFLAIVAQGLLGGLRVLQGSTDDAEDNRLFAMIHGVGAQVIFAALVALAVRLGGVYRSIDPAGDPDAKRLRIFATATLHTLLLQLVLGAVYRHFRHGHALWTHAGFSVIVISAAVLAGVAAIAYVSKTRSETGGPPLAALGKSLLAIVSFQFLLGWVAFGLGTERVDTDSVAQALVRTSHQANGALLIALATAIFTYSRRLAPRGMAKAGPSRMAVAAPTA
jgi:cytochrome c oxidase assembly protein subunit 15